MAFSRRVRTRDVGMRLPFLGDESRGLFCCSGRCERGQEGNRANVEAWQRHGWILQKILELTLLHLREEVASLEVVVGGLGRKRLIVLALHLPLGLGRFRGVLFDQGSELLVIALRHAGAPISKCWTDRSISRVQPDRKSTRLNSSHGYISYAVFCLKKKKIH